ncbi:MAG: hypothetical protein HZB65_03015 [Candidatus Aenigmarchaeota archaeon]|nr:hypothetical protein [Candidatus Aenigmarchaeota archaeon]
MAGLIVDKYAMCQADLCTRDAEYLLRWHEPISCKPESCEIYHNQLAGYLSSKHAPDNTTAVSQTYSCANPAHLEEVYFFSRWLNKTHPEIILSIKSKKKEMQILEFIRALLDNHIPIHNEPKLAFKTEKGSSYYIKSNGLWLRQKYNGDIFNGDLYIGSVNPDQNNLYRDNMPEIEPNKQIIDMIKEICSGKIPGFTPLFAPGNSPLGIKGYRPDEITIKRSHDIANPVNNLDMQTGFATCRKQGFLKVAKELRSFADKEGNKTCPKCFSWSNAIRPENQVSFADHEFVGRL